MLRARQTTGGTSRRLAGQIESAGFEGSRTSTRGLRRIGAKQGRDNVLGYLKRTHACMSMVIEEAIACAQPRAEPA